MSDCGTCCLCCKLLGIQELGKTTNVWCQKCRPGKGCTIYPTRPPSCQDFKCLWLLSRTEQKITPMPDDMRPDRVKVIFVTQDDQIQVHVDPGFKTAFRAEKVQSLILRMADSNVRVVISFGLTDEKIVYQKRGGLVTVQSIKVSAPDENGVQTFIQEN